MQKIMLLILFNVYIKITLGQVCNCNEIIEKTISKIEDNYIGFANYSKSNDYKTYKTRVIQLGKHIETLSECKILQYDYLKYFKDKHIMVFVDNSNGTEFSLPQYFKTGIDSIYFFDKIYSNFSKKANIEGEWHTSEFKYFIVQDSINKKKFYAFVLESTHPKWKKGDLKAIFYRRKSNYLVDFTSINYNQTIYESKFSDKNIVINKSSYWYRPGHLPPTNIISSNKILSYITDSTTFVILKIKSFSITKHEIDSFLYPINSYISKCPHLIIDLRDNLGGSTQSFNSLRKFLYTNPIKIENAYFHSSKDIIELFEESLIDIKDTLSERYKSIKYLIYNLKKNIGNRVVDSGFTYIQDSIFTNPKKVSIIINNKSGSASELFLISALQSKKVTLFGENSYGAGDKLDAYRFAINCNNIKIAIPISLRIGEIYKPKIDNIGIAPHVRISPNKENIYEYILKYHTKNENL